MPNMLAVISKAYPQVKRLKDAKRSIEVEVTRADGKAARKRDHHGCAMAEACKRSFKLDGAMVGGTIAYMIKGATAYRYEVPESVGREIVSFDRGAGFMTGKYQLAPMSPTRRFGVRKQQNPPRGDGTGKRMKFKKRHQTANMRANLALA
jgi:hypothetical protein